MPIEQLLAILGFFVVCVLPLYRGLYKMNTKVTRIDTKMGFLYTHWYNKVDDEEKD